MDPVRVIIFIAAFVLLLIVGRMLSHAGEVQLSAPPPQLPETASSPPPTPLETASAKPPATVGADLPFPIKIPDIECDDDGRYNRPEFLNYYFDQIDLQRGPEDPSSFYDDFHVIARDIESNFEGAYRYLVATPAGLSQAMASERIPALYLQEQAIIVPRWDLPLILETAVKQIMKLYAERGQGDEHALPAEGHDHASTQ